MIDWGELVNDDVFSPEDEFITEVFIPAAKSDVGLYLELDSVMNGNWVPEATELV